MYQCLGSRTIGPKAFVSVRPQLLEQSSADTIADTFRLSLELSAILSNMSIEVSVSLAKFTNFDTDT